MNSTTTLLTAVDLIDAPLVYKGKVRELYDLGEHYLMVVTDRISAFDYILKPGIPDKGKVLNLVSKFWFDQTEHMIPNHMVHADVNLLKDVIKKPELLQDRIMVSRKAERIDIECIVRGYITGGGWRQYENNGEINGIKLPDGMRKNQKLDVPIFTPSLKNDVGHDEDIPVEKMQGIVGKALTTELMVKSLELYQFAHDFCKERGIILADCKFEFGFVDGELILIDEIFTPDSSRYWAEEKYALDIDIDSMDKEPVRTFLSHSTWDKNSEPDPLPEKVVEETSARYKEILNKLDQ
ncbi:phosphoribosylaminoimidazolesuccinocarboxamide synthase [Chengkuizengella axinellae]|uniref:Phosphoribosylaminoimidazole-succinocarboxamide synthase n=1 Tax=Chengkuizengella axinellae TaxID=3064388 RepID=A0ABT9J6L1_9BACL|nr:phosphoribosylaminoimidazolesuccinocarboxamide synthase [Chengkuizengella sp. 2205SS18-9]MDP5277082.1 phosphoribosylaminoimidazolesuccinocarboxamide synthase [Chengkuizengella sp. 2205SS18-9]